MLWTGDAMKGNEALKRLVQASVESVDRLVAALNDGTTAKREYQKLVELLDAAFLTISQKFPEMERKAWEWVDTLFAPRVVIRQFLIAIALELGLITYQLASKALYRLVNKLTARGRQISETRRRMDKAKNYYEWLKCAERLDELEGRNKWREIPECNMYNHRLLQVSPSIIPFVRVPRGRSGSDRSWIGCRSGSTRSTT
jgi:hypothetical protein